MKNIIFYFSLVICFFALFLCIFAGLGNSAPIQVSPYLAGWVLIQGLFFLYLGRRMALDMADYRIAAVMLFTLGQLVMWLNWDKRTEMEGVGFALGIFTLATGFFWGLCDHYIKQDLIQEKNRSD